MNKNDDNEIRTLDKLLRESGVLDHNRSASADDRRWAAEVVAALRTQVAEDRRRHLPKSVPIRKAEPISERLLAMPRTVLEALFASLVERLGSRAQFAYRKLDMLSDNDLRRMIQTIESHTQPE